MSKLVNCALALVLLTGQVFLLEHQLDLNAHQSGEICQVCLASSPLGEAVSSTATAGPVVLGFAAALPSRHPDVAAQPRFLTNSVRAPPYPHLIA
ncbi:MAG: hypothetical protein AMS22_00090 [Thiotrichales bacterium SG8_50]|nr:MAG: hypothetical protein AMS22_00090 [Thiotrichales bacterium SG8_50]